MPLISPVRWSPFFRTSSSVFSRATACAASSKAPSAAAARIRGHPTQLVMPNHATGRCGVRWHAGLRRVSPKLLDERKQAIRERVWALLEERRAAAFPGAWGRIPNFVGASAAAERLAGAEEWQAAHVIKSNPDAPQRYVRLRALREGKIVYMAVPRLRQARCFWELDPRRLKDLRAAASIQGAAAAGR